MKPRCRWLIDGKLTPYRLLVALIENRRIGGKVRQEHVADLGSIDGYLLPGFYPAGAPAVDKWRHASVIARDEFWKYVRVVLARLANRVSAEAADSIVAAIAQRIPIPTADDIWAADLIELKSAARSFQYFHNHSKERIEHNARTRSALDREDAELRQDADENAANMVKAQTEVLERLSRR